MSLQREITFTQDNQITLLHSGRDFFPALIAAIDDAQSSIALETYIFSEDITANLVRDALCRAAQRGVKVQVVVDWWGTGYHRCKDLEAYFTAHGVEFRKFNPWFRRGVARSHRKLFVADTQIAIIGGININHDLFAEGENKHVLEYPRWDFAASIRGPLVVDIAELVSDQWQKLGKMHLHLRLKMLLKPNKPTTELNHPVIAGLAPRDNFFFRRTIQRAYLQALTNAQHHALIVTPYFAPGRKFRRALIKAAKRGVKVTLLIGRGDFRFQDAVTQSYYPKLLKYGVAIYEYHKSQLHAKVATVDDQWATIGSSNCDGLSMFINQEANILVKDKGFSEDLSVAIWAGIAESVRIEWADYANIPWHKKIWYGCAFFT